MKNEYGKLPLIRIKIFASKEQKEKINEETLKLLLKESVANENIF